MTEEQFARLVAKTLRDKDAEMYVDAENDIVDGKLVEVIDAVFEVLHRHGPVAFTD